MRKQGPVSPVLAAVLAAALAVTSAGCSSGKPSADKCQSVSAPLTDIPTRTDQEPKLRIPVPTGWERSTKNESEQIRFSIRNQALTADGFTPNAVVTLQKVAGDLGKPDQILQAQQDQLTKKLNLKDVTTTATNVCGTPALSSTYNTPELKLPPMRGQKEPVVIPVRKATSLAMVYRAGDSNYVATVTVQTVKADDPAYIKDTDEILKGFQLIPPR
jgi:hypothetical protein